MSQYETVFHQGRLPEKTIYRRAEAGKERSVQVMLCVTSFLICALQAATDMLPQHYGMIHAGMEGWNHICDILIICGSPMTLLAMTGGALFLHPEEDVRGGDIAKKAVLLAVGYVLWTALYAMMHIHMMDPRPGLGIQLALRQWLSAAGDLWYVPVMITLLVLVPILRPIVAAEQPGLFRYIVLIFAGALVFNTINYLYGIPYGQTYIFPALAKVPMLIICQYLFWMLLGGIIYAHPPGRALRLAAYAAGIAACIAEHFLMTGGHGLAAGAYDLISADFTIFTFCKSAGLFCFVTAVFRPGYMSKAGSGFLRLLGGSAVTIYLLQGIAIEFMIWRGFFLDKGWSPAVTALAWACAAWIAGAAVGMVWQGIRIALTPSCDEGFDEE